MFATRTPTTIPAAARTRLTRQANDYDLVPAPDHGRQLLSLGCARQALDPQRALADADDVSRLEPQRLAAYAHIVDERPVGRVEVVELEAAVVQRADGGMAARHFEVIDGYLGTSRPITNLRPIVCRSPVESITSA
jgi:hypothetical protein